jgi:hypothetical protein
LILNIDDKAIQKIKMFFGRVKYILNVLYIIINKTNLIQ